MKNDKLQQDGGKEVVCLDYFEDFYPMEKREMAIETHGLAHTFLRKLPLSIPRDKAIASSAGDRVESSGEGQLMDADTQQDGILVLNHQS